MVLAYSCGTQLIRTGVGISMQGAESIPIMLVIPNFTSREAFRPSVYIVRTPSFIRVSGTSCKYLN